MNEKILEVTETLARRVCNLGVNYKSAKFSVTGKTVDITMTNGIVITKITFPRQLVEETINFLVEYPEADIVSIYAQVAPPDRTLEDMCEEDESEAQEEPKKETKKILKKRG